MKIVGLILVVFLVGCQTAGQEYYAAVEKVAIAQAQAQQAKADALLEAIKSGDSSASGSAVMALALMQSPQTQVIPQRSAALEYTKSILPIVGSLGAMWISADASKSTSRHAMQSNLARINQEGQKTTALYDLLGSNNENMLTLGLGSYEAINVAGQQSVDLGLGLGLASINGSTGGGDNSAVLDAINNINYASNFQSILDAIGGITVPNYDSQLDNILNKIQDANTVWVAGVNCVNNQTSGQIGVGGINTALPVCPSVD